MKAFVWIVLALILSFINMSPGISATLNRDGKSWEIVGYDELKSSTFWTFFAPPKSVYVGQHIVTSGTLLNCDMTEEFSLRSPEGSIATSIPSFPMRLATLHPPFPAGSSGDPVSYSGDKIDYAQWVTVPGFSAAQIACKKFVSVNGGTPGFLVFGEIRRNQFYNALVVEKIEFAEYSVGIFSSLWNAIPSGTTRFLLGMVTSYYGLSNSH